MAINKNLFLLIIFLIFVSYFNVSAKNIEDFGWSFKKNSNEVYTIIDNYQMHHCKLNINEFKLEQEIKPLWNESLIKKPDIYNIKSDQIINVVNNQYLPTIKHELMSNECNTERYEQFTYCPSSKEIVQYEVDMFITPDQLLNNVHWNQGSEFFIGHSNEEKLLKSNYWQGPSTRILAYNDKSKTLRETQLIPVRISDTEVKGVIRHKFIKMVNGDIPHDLCPNI
tara:strand:+ start:1109 stop:1783 length:675 start_codon:yes stop_codon:yes gene_type:complete